MKRVLPTDDHAPVMDGMAPIAEKLGDYEIVGRSGNGKEAIDLIKMLRPDLVLMDAEMPVMSGLYATRRRKRTA